MLDLRYYYYYLSHFICCIVPLVLTILVLDIFLPIRVGLLGCSFATPITFVENIYEVVALLWLVLFFGAAVLPACSGIIVSIVPRHSRPVSSSLSLVIFNLFGYFLSLVLSGLLMQVKYAVMIGIAQYTIHHIICTFFVYLRTNRHSAISVSAARGLVR